MKQAAASIPVALSAVLVLAAGSGCNERPGLPSPGSAEYRQFCSAFYLGLAALQSGEDVNARRGLERATQIAPGEPAGWVNLALLESRQQEFDAAIKNLQRARALAPGDGRIEELLGMVESRRGKIPEAMAHYRKAVSLDGANVRALYAWAMETEREQGPTSSADALELLTRIHRLRPDNERVLLDIIRLAAKENDAARLNEAINSLGRNESGWPEISRQRYARLREAAANQDPRGTAIEAQFLGNTLIRTESFRRGLEEVKPPGNAAGEPFLRFLKLPPARSAPAPPDNGLRFEEQPLKAPRSRGVGWIGPVALGAEEGVAIVWADATSLHVGDSVRLPLPHERFTRPQWGVYSILGADLNYDFKTDLVVATPSGLRIYQQTAQGGFVDWGTKSRLAAPVLAGAYTGAWAIDFDLDGDLDIVLGTARGEPPVLRNNGDGTFVPVYPFKGVNGLVSFSSADIDGEGTPDVTLVDAGGGLYVFQNERLGAFRRREIPPQLVTGNAAAAAGDMDGDGLIDLAVLRTDSRIIRLADGGSGSAWKTEEAARVAGGPKSLLLADLDNNGSLDIIAGGQVLLGDGTTFAAGPAVPLASCSVVDLNRDGRLDLIGLSAAGTAAQFMSFGTKRYHWQVIRPKAAVILGDQRINPFGIGGEIEVRSGLFTQKQVINSPHVHFGLGENDGVEFARIVWPNGIVQSEFELKADQSIAAPQRLKGSCPFLFTWDGKRMRFVKDAGPMSASLGAHADGQALEPIHHTEQWFKIDGDQLAPRSSYYDVRLTNEYWETHYADRYALMVVDHPKGSHVYVDERVAPVQPALKVYVTAVPRAFASAKDERGQDAGAAVNQLDARHLSTFAKGQYLGFARDHWVELEVPEDAPQAGPLYMIADGSLRPWDETVTVARNQGNSPRPRSLRIEVPDGEGRWVTAQDDLGVPAGRLKTVVFEVGRLFRPGAPRRLRLRTNLEIYWDRIAWAAGVSSAGISLRLSALQQAELRYRGYSLLTRDGPSSPELAHYDAIVRTAPQWRDLEGYYTRYGDVRELLETADDRIVLVNSADELRLRFAAPPPPAAGWIRDYVFISDGWIKEGDYNFRFSKSVLPLPHHGMRTYAGPLLPLERDAAYRKHPSDWLRFHTRYVTPKQFARALWRP
ncbi:MAG: FG-GAP-like repeat-containing protein [Bryobacterales bacterium]|nr:FG-GAP-like repeat-containing protein [Bryobacterales bacterium]